MSTESLLEMCYRADDTGRETYIEWHPTFNVIEYIEIDGEEIYNPIYLDEVEDAKWESDSLREAELRWRG